MTDRFFIKLFGSQGFKTNVSIMKRGLHLIALLLFIHGCTKISEPEGIDLIPPVEEKPKSRVEIKISSENPGYWEYKDEPILLIGASEEDNLYQYPADGRLHLYYDDQMTLIEHLDILQEIGGNYVRGSLSSRNQGNRFPYLKTSGTPGVNVDTDVYDLDQWDQEWIDRLDTFLDECEKRDIIVQLEFFDRFDLRGDNPHHPEDGIYNTGWNCHPWNPDRNTSYTSQDSGLPGGSYTGGNHPLWYCVPELSHDPAAPGAVVLETLKNYVDKVLDITFKYGNVLYQIENETLEPLEFGAYWTNYIKDKAESEGKNVFVTNQARENELNNPRQQEIRRSSKYDFYDFSQNWEGSDYDAYYNNWLAAKEDIADEKTETDMKPLTAVKLYGGSLGWTGGSIRGITHFWVSLFAGAASARFHRPPSGIGINADAQAHIKSARMLFNEFNVFTSEPNNSLLSNRSYNEAWCLAEIGKQYAVYFRDGGSVEIDMSEASGDFEVKWLKIEESEWSATFTISGGGKQTLSAPSTGQKWVALILKK